VEEWKKREPIHNFASKLRENNIITDKELEEIEKEIREAIEEAVRYAEESKVLEFDELYNLVYA